MKIGCQIGVWEAGGVEEAIAGIGAADLDGIEMFEMHIVPYYEKAPAFKEWLDRAGIELSGVYFGSDKFIDPAGEQEVLDNAGSACDFLRAVGCRFLVMNGGVGKAEGQAFSEDDFKRMARIANRIGVESKERGVRTVMHPHARCMIETCADVDRLLEAGLDQDNVGLCVHAGHQLAAGTDPYEMYDKYAAWVRYLHIGNTGADGKGALLGEGVLDENRLHKPLFDAGYDGWIIIECRKEGVSSTDYCNNARNYMKAEWPEANWE